MAMLKNLHLLVQPHNQKEVIVPHKGLLISVEGGEGVGKSTAIQATIGRLLADGVDVVAAREPGGVEISEKIRDIVLNPDYVHMDFRTEALLMAASRAQLIKEVYNPALDKGSVVIVDRFVDSTYAYQSFGRGLDFAEIRQINTFATEGLLPHRTYLLDAPVETGVERQTGSGHSHRFDLQDPEFFERVRQGYLYLAKAESERFVVIDATDGPEQIADIIHDDIKALLSQRQRPQES